VSAETSELTDEMVQSELSALQVVIEDARVAEGRVAGYVQRGIRDAEFTSIESVAVTQLGVLESSSRYLSDMQARYYPQADDRDLPFRNHWTQIDSLTGSIRTLLVELRNSE
jgi:hypothetical protein